MRCPECKHKCPPKAVSCEECGATRPRPVPVSPLATVAGLACVGALAFQFGVPAGAARNAAPPPPSAQAAARGPGPTLNGVAYERSSFVKQLDLTQPAPHGPRR